jgi:hypothetical protein
MDTTQAALEISQVLKHNHFLRARITAVKWQMEVHIKNVQQQIDSIAAALAIEYTGHFALLKRTDTGWQCLACVDSANLPDDLPEDFDLCLPIPKPETMPEWEGW